MQKRWMDVIAGAVIVGMALAVWLPQLRWGLPSREADRWLFGGRPAWSGREILSKLATQEAGSLSPEFRGEGTSRGADVDATPILDRSQPVVLNDTDAKRAAIVQRFRLMSGQPDEFIQFKALAEMSQRSGLARLDPRIYQYGGLWIYPVGGLVRGAMAAGWIETPPAGVSVREFYLDRPDAFGKFYVVGRAYSMAWGIVAAIAVYFLARRASSRDATASLVFEEQPDARTPATALRRGSFVERVLPLLAAIAFVLLPSVQTSAHEAKPHLAGAAICLLATLAASHYAATGKRRFLWIAGALCGAAMGMVVSMVLSLIVLPAAVWMQNPRPRTRGRTTSCRGQVDGVDAGGSQDAFDPQAPTPSPQPSPPGTGAREPQLVRSLAGATVIALFVYAITNPFVLINAFAAPHLLRSNLGNSTAMYGVRGPLAMIPDAMRIAGHAMTPIGFRFAIATALALVVGRFLSHGLPARRASAEWAGSPCHLWIAPATVIAIQFVLLAAGKPAEYARFGLVVWAALCVAAAIAVRAVFDSPARMGGTLLVAVGVCLFIPPFDLDRHGYDAWKWTDVDDSATQLDTMRSLGTGEQARWRLGVAYEPAPWSTPPVNLFDQDIVLVRATPEMLESVDLFVWPVNLESQCFAPAQDRESLDWKANRFGHRAEPRDGEADRWSGGW